MEELKVDLPPLKYQPWTEERRTEERINFFKRHGPTPEKQEREKERRMNPGEESHGDSSDEDSDMEEDLGGLPKELKRQDSHYPGGLQNIAGEHNLGEAQTSASA